MKPDLVIILQPASRLSLPSAASGVRPGAWEFRWLDDASPKQTAQLTGQLRWQGFDLGFCADGLAGLDGRLNAPSLAKMPIHLQEVVLHHLAGECLHGLLVGPLAGLSIVSLNWHETLQPMQGEFAFAVRRPGAPGMSHGCITVFDEVGRGRFIDALAALNMPLPASVSQVLGRLQIGSLRVEPQDFEQLEEGDLVWLDDAEFSPQGVRSRFQTAPGEAGWEGWIKRSVLHRDTMQRVALWEGAGLGEDGAHPVQLAVKSNSMWVSRAWLQGGAPLRLPASLLSMEWEAFRDGEAVFQGRLVLVGRRLGLRITRLQRSVAPTNDDR